MSPVEKALWYVEGHLRQEISLADIAASTWRVQTSPAARVRRRDRPCLSCAMCAVAASARRLSDWPTVQATSSVWPWMPVTTRTRHSRGRSATSSAPRLPKFASRASVGQLALVQPIALDAAPLEIAGPRFETLDVLLVAGLNRRYDGLEDSAGVPGQWEQFAAEQLRIRGRVGATAYGVCFNLDDEGSMDYMCGVQVAAFGSQPSQFTCLRIPRQKYAVFVHREHIAGIRRTWDAIWNGWLPQSGHDRRRCTAPRTIRRSPSSRRAAAADSRFSSLELIEMKLNSLLPVGVALAMTLPRSTSPRIAAAGRAFRRLPSCRNLDRCTGVLRTRARQTSLRGERSARGLRRGRRVARVVLELRKSR